MDNILGRVEEEARYLLQTTACLEMELFEKRGTLPSPRQACVDYIRTNQPGFSFPLIRRVISKTVIFKLQNICFLQPVCSFPPDIRHLCP